VNSDLDRLFSDSLSRAAHDLHLQQHIATAAAGFAASTISAASRAGSPTHCPQCSGAEHGSWGGAGAAALATEVAGVTCLSDAHQSLCELLAGASQFTVRSAEQLTRAAGENHPVLAAAASLSLQPVGSHAVGNILLSTHTPAVYKTPAAVHASC